MAAIKVESVTREELMAEFRELIVNVCLRPRMYTPSGSYHEVVAFLDGYDFAVRRHWPDIQDPTGLRGFLDWLIEHYRDRCNGMGNLTWSAYVRAAFPEEEEALAGLPGLFARYLAQTSASP